MSITAKAARVNCNLKITEVAEKLSISTDKLYRIESGQSVPDVNLAKKMSEVYGVPIDDLIFFNQ